MRTAIWKEEHPVKVYENQEDGKTIYIIEFENGTSIQSISTDNLKFDEE